MSDKDARKSGEEGMNAFSIGFLAIGLIIGVIMGIAVGGFVIPQNQTHGSMSANVLTPEEAGEKAVEFISSVTGTEVQLVNISEVEGENLYKIVINLSAMGRSAESYITKDGKLLFPEGIVVKEVTIGNFFVSDDEICMDDGKPIIYFFGSEGCGACKWEHPVMANVTAKFEGFISFHDNIGSTADQEIFDKYSTGYIPTLVLGCKYYRVGAGKNMGEDQEAKVLTALICKLTGNKPEEVCNDPEIEALINQIE